MLLPPPIHTACGPVVGGISRLFVIPASAVVALPDPLDYDVTASIVLVPGAVLTELELPDGQGEYSEDPAENDHGLLYKKKVSVFVPLDAPSISRWAAQLARAKYCIVIYQDAMGFWKLVGDLHFPLAFGPALSTGKTATSANGHEFTWSGEGLDKAHFYGGFDVIPDSGTGTPGGGGTPGGETALPVTIKDGNGSVLATIQPGGSFQINSGFSYGFRIL